MHTNKPSEESNLRDVLREEYRVSSELYKVLTEEGICVLDIIGKGAYSIVKRAYDSRRKKDVAVKIVSKVTKKDGFMDKFLTRELDVIKGLRHPNIIKFYDYVETSLRCYLIMQYAERGPLSKLIFEQKFLPEWEAWKYFKQLVNAVEYIHNAGIAHRDIKCDNIVLCQNDTLKLIDFGFACRVRDGADKDEGETQSCPPYLSQTYCGSHAYVSPEVLRLKPYQPLPCDVWSSGVVLYLMLFGRHPFAGKEVPVLLENILKGLKFPETTSVSNEAKRLLHAIFSPVRKRPNMTQIRKCRWLHKSPPKPANNDDADGSKRKRVEVDD